MRGIFPYYDILVNYDGGPTDKVFRVLGLRRAGFAIAVQFTTFMGARTFELDMNCLTRISCENILNFLKSQQNTRMTKKPNRRLERAKSRLEYLKSLAFSAASAKILSERGKQYDPFYELYDYPSANLYPGDIFVNWKWSYVGEDGNPLDSPRYLQDVTENSISKIFGIKLSVFASCKTEKDTETIFMFRDLPKSVLCS